MTYTITDHRWRVDIGIGLDESSDWRHEWTIYQGDRDVVEDDVYVLGGLTFGWAITTAYWPAQPVPQTCSVALNVPNFNDLADLVQGDAFYVKVRPYAAEMTTGPSPHEVDGPVVAQFFGRVTDLTAAPRSGRTGVTIAVTAVDYTADLTEGLNSALKSLRPWLYEFFVVQEPALANILWTYLGGTPDTIDDLWTSEVRFVNIGRVPDAVGPAIEALLLSAFVWDTVSGSHRMLVSPRVDADGRLIDPTVGRMFTLDTINLPNMSDPADVEFPAQWFEKNIQWVQDKNNRPGTALITVELGITEGDTIATTVEQVVAEGLPAVSLDNIEADDYLGPPDRSEEMAAFYLGDPASDDRWQIESVVLRPELAPNDDDVLHQLATDLLYLFPRWDLDESDPGRARAYTTRISLVDIEPTWLPYEALSYSTNGIVTGATVKISGRQLSFDLALRRMRHEIDEPEA